MAKHAFYNIRLKHLFSLQLIRILTKYYLFYDSLVKYVHVYKDALYETAN